MTCVVYPPNNKRRRGRAARGDLLDLADAVELDRAGAGSDDVEAVALGALGDAWAFLRGLTLRAEASHILVRGKGGDAERRIGAIRDEIGDDPDRFAEVAARSSDCPSARQGGNLGEFGRYSMVPEFDRVVFAEEVGVVHGPIETSFGYHLILIRRRTGTTG